MTPCDTRETMGGSHAREKVFKELGLEAEDRAAWEVSGLPEEEFEGWVIDRVARRPSGNRARTVYGADDVHDFARRAILDALTLAPDDSLLDVGCGGGLLLRDALALGAMATGVDHSEEMVRLAWERAPGSTVWLAGADRLPFPNVSFTAVSMSVVFFFLDTPVAVLREARRVLAVGGRIAVYTAAPELQGTPAAPEPVASHGNFYRDEQLLDLAREAELTNPQVINDGGGQLLTARV